MAVDSTTYLADAKSIYGAIQEQVSTLAAFMNLLDNGPMNDPITTSGMRGYTFLARLAPNWDMGYRTESTTGVGASGNQGLAQATVGLAYAYVPITITGQAENLTKGNARAFMQAKALEAKFDMKDIVSHANVVMVGADRGGVLAIVSAPAAGSFTAGTAAGQPGAIYLRVGMPIDTNAVGGGALTLNDATITAINYTTRVVTVPGTAVAGEAVTLHGEAALTTGTFPVTAESLASLVSDTGARQGLNPATAGQASWASYVKDAATTVITSALIHEQIAFTKNRSGEEPDIGVWPSAQVNQLVGIATTTLRFDVNAASASPVGKKALDLGFQTYSYGGRPIIEDKDCRPDRTYWGRASMMRKFEPVPLSLAEDEAGTWTRITGTNGIADATSGLLRWYHQLGIMQRSAWSVMYGLTVPTTFQTAPPTL